MYRRYYNITQYSYSHVCALLCFFCIPCTSLQPAIKVSVPNTSPRSCWQLWWHVHALPPRGPCVPGWSSDCRSASPGRIHRALQYPKNFCAFHKKLRWIWYIYIYKYNSLHIQYIYIYDIQKNLIKVHSSNQNLYPELNSMQNIWMTLGLTSPGSSLFHIFTPTSRSGTLRKLPPWEVPQPLPYLRLARVYLVADCLLDYHPLCGFLFYPTHSKSIRLKSPVAMGSNHYKNL